MYFWRVPVLLLAVILVVIGLLIVVTAAIRVRHLVSNVVARAALLAGVLVLFVVSPWITDSLIVRLNPTDGIGRIYIDPSFITLLAPAMVVLVLVTIASALFRRHPSPTPTARWTAGFYLFSVAVMVSNSINMCSPGWCWRFGFPFPYYYWSDAVMVFNGQTPSSWSPAAALLDVIVYVAASIAIGLAYRQKFTRLPSGGRGASSV